MSQQPHQRQRQPQRPRQVQNLGQGQAIPMPPRSTPAVPLGPASQPVQRSALPPTPSQKSVAPSTGASIVPTSGPVPSLPPRKPGEPRTAVALTYDPANAAAPVVTAVGQGLVAEEIIRRAQAAGVPITEDPRLTAVLSQIDVGAVIPPELYAVVAEVLAYVYRLDDRVNRRR